jgi:hypothetical protein
MSLGTGAAFFSFPSFPKRDISGSLIAKGVSLIGWAPGMYAPVDGRPCFCVWSEDGVFLLTFAVAVMGIIIVIKWVNTN